MLLFQVTNLVNDRKFVVMSTEICLCRICRVVDEMLQQIQRKLRKYEFSDLAGCSIHFVDFFSEERFA